MGYQGSPAASPTSTSPFSRKKPHHHPAVVQRGRAGEGYPQVVVAEALEPPSRGGRAFHQHFPHLAQLGLKKFFFLGLAQLPHDPGPRLNDVARQGGKIGRGGAGRGE